jgi:glycosyltransferase involved in cell wall biosynthesis
MARCDLHVHSIHSTDSGNYALRRARLGESFTEPDRIYETCRRRGMDFVTISDHNTVEGALRIADKPGTFLSVEVTTRFPEDDAPLHVLVWNLSEEDHRDLQPYRPSVYELAAFLRERGLPHALAHPLYRMGPPLTVSHIERMMLLFGTWEGRNGARPESSNHLACRLAAAVTPDYLGKLTERHNLEPGHAGRIGLTGGSDDHGALDIAMTWTEAAGETVEEFLASVTAGHASPRGEHGSTVKLAHAVGSLALNAYRQEGRVLPAFLADHVAPLFDNGADSPSRHEEIMAVSSLIASVLGERAREGGIGLDTLPSMGGRVGQLLLAGALEVPFLASMKHHTGTQRDVEQIESAFFGIRRHEREPRSLVFTDTFAETNGVAGTMRWLAGAGAAEEASLAVVTAHPGDQQLPGVISLDTNWTLKLPVYESIELRFPLLTKVLSRVEAERPDVIHIATPGPIGLCGLAAAKLLGLPLVGSYHTELGPYALHLTKDALVADSFAVYVDWFYRQCDLVLAPTHAVGAELERRGLQGRVQVWGRGVDSAHFNPARRHAELREELLGGGDVLLLSVGRVSNEKRVDVLLEAFRRLRAELPGVRLVVVGDGPARETLQERAPSGATFLGELRGDALADLYASADIFCFPSTTDTFGQVLLEAGASGLPVVAAAAGGAPELVQHGSTGLLVPPDDVGSFRDAIHTLAISPLARERIGRAARASACGRDWTRSLQELQASYRSAVAWEDVPTQEQAHAA